jgi:hypothetical protein
MGQGLESISTDEVSVRIDHPSRVQRLQDLNSAAGRRFIEAVDRNAIGTFVVRQ